MPTAQNKRATAGAEAPLVTAYLEMTSPKQLRPKKVTSGGWRVTRLKESPNSWQFNRDMYFRVGEEWRWIDKQPWTEAHWANWAKEIRTFAAYFENKLAGYYELHAESEPDGRHGVEIAYFGLLPEFIGRGLGGALLTSAIEEAWRMSPAPARVWVHTCNRDHPQALANYQARGMAIYKVTSDG